MSKVSGKTQAKAHDAVSTVERAAIVLSAFRQSWDFLTLSDVVEYTGLTKPTVFRILSSLSAEGLIFQNEANNTYGLGFLNLRLADVFLSHQLLRQFALPIMQKILDRLNENVVLGVRDGERTYDIQVLESTQVIVPSQTCGLAVSLHESVAGRALLASASAEDRASYFKNHKGKLATLPGGEKKIKQYLRQIEAVGYASDSGGILLGGHTVSKTFANGKASLSISFPLARFSSDLEKMSIKLLEEAVDLLAGNLPD